MGTWDDNPTTTTLDTRNLQNPQSWVFLETPDTSALLLVRREHITGRSALSKPADRSPTPVSEQRESIWSEESILPEEARFRSRPTGVQHPYRSKENPSCPKRAYYRKKRAFEAGRQESNTRIGAKRIHLVRTRGGNRKFRALRLDSGNFSWASEGIARKVRVIVVAFHPS